MIRATLKKGEKVRLRLPLTGYNLAVIAEGKRQQRGVGKGMELLRVPGERRIVVRGYPEEITRGW